MLNISELNSKKLRLNSKTLLGSRKTKKTQTTGIVDVNQAASYCLKGLADAVPPTFCWKKGGDAGEIPTGCPAGYFRSLALCYKYCDRGYDFVLGVCWEICSAGGYTNLGLICSKSIFNWHWKKSYMPHGITNFSSSIPCPKGKYRFGALCYKNCNNLAMVNCGIGACSRDTASCVTSIINMAIDVVNAVITAVAFVLSLGTSTAITSLKQSAMNGLKKIGLKGVKAIAKSLGKSLVGKFKNIIKDKAIKKFQTFIRDSAIQGISNAVAYNFCNSLVDDTAEKMSKGVGAAAASSLDFIVDSVDFIGLRSTISACSDTSDGGVACAKGVIGGISNFDPTGITTLIATFIHPTCDVPLEPERPIYPDVVSDKVGKDESVSGAVKPAATQEEKDIHKAQEEIKKVANNCIRLHADCNFSGTYVDICSDSPKLPSNMNNQVSSITVGEEAHGVLFADENYQGAYLLLRGANSVECLADEVLDGQPVVADNILSSLKMNGDECVIITVTTVEGDKRTPTNNLACEDGAVNFPLPAEFNNFSVTVLKNGYHAKILDARGAWVEAFDHTPFSGDFKLAPLRNAVATVELKPIVDPNCIRFYTECNYRGGYKDICEDTSYMRGIAGHISSYIVGLQVKPGHITDTAGFSGRFLKYDTGEKVPCLKDVKIFELVADRRLSSLKMDSADCLIITWTQVNSLTSNFVCEDTPSMFIDLVGSLFLETTLWLERDGYRVELYSEDNYEGQQWVIESSSPDWIEDPPIEAIRSAKFVRIEN